MSKSCVIAVELNNHVGMNYFIERINRNHE
jgi:hypothetical protein